MIAVNKDPISPKLLSLERRMGDIANTAITTSGDELKLFTQEVEENLTDPYGDKYGYITYQKNILFKMAEPDSFTLLSLLSLGVLNLFGMPYQNIRYKVEVELRVLDSRNRLIGKYSAIGEANSFIACYYGYESRDAYRRTYPGGSERCIWKDQAANSRRYRTFK